MTWQREANTTLVKYFKGAEDNVMRNRVLTAMLKQEGRIEYNLTGRSIERRVKMRRVPLVGYDDMDIVDFARQDRWKIAALPWRGYVIADAYSKMEMLKNRGKEALIDLVDGIKTNLEDDAMDSFAEELYQDGNVAGEKGIHGIDSFTGNSGATGDGSTTTTADGFRIPTDTFAGLLTTLGNYGGSQTSGSFWPNGTCDAQFDFWTPVLIDYTDATAWGGGSFDTWAENAIRVLRAGLAAMQRRGGKKSKADFVITTREMYVDALNLMETKERIVVNKASPLINLGFGNVFNLDGTDVTWEYGVPATVAYGFNVKQMLLRSMQGTIFDVDGPHYEPNDKTYRCSLDFFGNCWWNPAYFCRWDNYT